MVDVVIDELIAKGLDEIREDLSVLLDRDVTFTVPILTWVEKDAGTPGAPYEAELLIEAGESAAAGRIRFQLRDAILLSGLLMMASAPVLAEKLRERKLADDDADAVAEIGNQICGNLNNCWSRSRPDADFHLRRGETWLSGKAPAPLENGPVLAAAIPFEIADQPPGEFHLIFDADAVRAIFGVEPGANEEEPAGASAAPATARHADAPSERAGAASSFVPRALPARAASEESPYALLLFEVRRDAELLAAHVESFGTPTRLLRLGSDVGRLICEGNVGLILIDTTERKERGFAAARRLVRYAEPYGIPVIHCAKGWRRDEVQRAVQAGIARILVKPLDPSHVAGLLRPAGA